MHSNLKKCLAFTTLEKKIQDFERSLPIVELMAHPAMQKRHWMHLETITNYKYNIFDEFSLRNVIQAPLLQFKEEIEVIFLKL